MNSAQKVLAIETSCDETALAIVEVELSAEQITAHELDSELFSQIDIHKEFGGVFPAVAKREHAKHAPLLLEKLLKTHSAEASSDTTPETWQQIETILEREPGMYEQIKRILSTYAKPDIDLIAVTQGPGLEPALWVGINLARALSLHWNIPLVGTNHMKGHIFSVLLNQQEMQFPALAFLISGGHTELVEMHSTSEFTVIGQTKDDAIGESYDKVARMIGLEYPGGPKIAQLAQSARESGIGSGPISLPRPMLHTPDFDFSFSGLKTAALYKIREFEHLDDQTQMHIAHEFEEAVTDVVVAKAKRALESHPYKTLIVSGGVIANAYLRSRLEQLASKYGIPLLLPKIADSTDNAQMIAVAGAIAAQQNAPHINPDLKAEGSLAY